MGEKHVKRLFIMKYKCWFIKINNLKGTFLGKKNTETELFLYIYVYIACYLLETIHYLVNVGDVNLVSHCFNLFFGT